MAGSLLVDASFLIALVSRQDFLHGWATVQVPRFPPPWNSCDAVLSETFHVLGRTGAPSLATLLRRGAVISSFHLGMGLEEVLRLMERYADLPMSFADACLVRMSEIMPNPLLLTADKDFRVYRRHNRQIVPCVLPD